MTLRVRRDTLVRSAVARYRVLYYQVGGGVENLLGLILLGLNGESFSQTVKVFSLTVKVFSLTVEVVSLTVKIVSLAVKVVGLAG